MSNRRADAVIEALRGFNIGDTVKIVAYDFESGDTGTVINISDYSGAIQVLTSASPLGLWFQRNELHLD